MSDEFTQMWTTVFRARTMLNDASLGAKLASDDLLQMIEDLLAVVDRLRSSYDAQYAQLWQACDLLGEMTGAGPTTSPATGAEEAPETNAKDRLF
jgi:hypothetical protein